MNFLTNSLMTTSLICTSSIHATPSEIAATPQHFPTDHTVHGSVVLRTKGNNSATQTQRPQPIQFMALRCCGIADEMRQQRNSNATSPAHAVRGVASKVAELRLNSVHTHHTRPFASAQGRFHHPFRSLLCTQTLKFNLTYQPE